MRALFRGFCSCAGLFLLACSGADRHSVLLVTLDTTRADALGAYGRSPSVTPNLDQLATEGVVFERAFTTAPLTLPAHTSMMTGLFPPRHGVRDNGIAALPQAATTLAERARTAGFQTAAFLGSVVLDLGFGLEQGFDRYEAPARRFYQGPTMGYSERPAIEVAALASSWLEARDPRRPFFLWVHLWDAHSPYEPGPDLLEHAGGDPYLGEVAACDVALGRILATLRAGQWLDSTLIVVVADHGEAFGEHDEVSHGAYVWNTTLHVPLILRLPSSDDAGERVREIASVVDVYPTALEAMGLELGKDEAGAIDGVSLLGPGPNAKRGVYFESYYGFVSYGWHPLTGWLDRDGKYIHSRRPLFFDFERDPGEEHDLLAQRAGKLAAYREAITALAGAPVLALDAEGIDPELKRSLQAVGYAAVADASTGLPDPLSNLELADPHERTAEQLEIQRAQGRIAAGDHASAEVTLEALVRANPRNLFAWDRLALCRMRMQRFAEAIGPLERVLAEGPGQADTWSYLGACRLVLGEDQKALAAFTSALELDPYHVQALGGLLHIMEGAGLVEQAAPFRKRFEAVQSRP